MEKTNLLYKNSINNQNGGMVALMSVVVLSMVIVTALSSVYIFLENRAKFQGRIRLSYQVTYSMEEIARVVGQGYDIAQANGGSSCGSTGMRLVTLAGFTGGSSASNVTLCVPSGTEYGDTGTNEVCVTNSSIVNPSDSDNPNRFCLTSLDDINTETMVAKASLLDKWYSRLDKFFDTTIVREAPKAQDIAWNILESEFQPPTYLGWLIPMSSQKAWAGYYYQGGTKSSSQPSYSGQEVAPSISPESTYVRNPAEDGTSTAHKDYLDQPMIGIETVENPPVINTQEYQVQVPQSGITTTEIATVEPDITQPGVTVGQEDNGENFLNLDPNYVEQHLSVSPTYGDAGNYPNTAGGEGSQTGNLGTGVNPDCSSDNGTKSKTATTAGSAGQFTNPDCPPTHTQSYQVRLVTPVCPEHVTSDSPTCMRCAAESGSTGAPCFDFQMNSPFSASTNSTGQQQTRFRLPIRLIR